MKILIAYDGSAQAENALQGKRALEKIRERFPGWKVLSRSVSGHPAEEIQGKSESWKPDLIVMGSHGRSALGSLLLGSVSQNVLHHAHASVRIVHGKPAAKA